MQDRARLFAVDQSKSYLRLAYGDAVSVECCMPDVSAANAAHTSKPHNTMPHTEFDGDSDSEDDVRTRLVEEIIRYVLRNELGKYERAEIRTERKRRRLLIA
jgi:hypothetical protein